MESLVNLRLETALWSHLMRLPLDFFQKLGTAIWRPAWGRSARCANWSAAAC